MPPAAFTTVLSVDTINAGGGATQARWTFSSAFSVAPDLDACQGLLIADVQPAGLLDLGTDWVELGYGPGDDPTGLPWNINPTFAIPDFADPLDTLESGHVT